MGKGDLALEIDWKRYELIPTISQDVHSQKVLMFAYSSKDSLNESIKSGLAHYFSRSKARIWRKGEHSGHIQMIKDILLDCDNDSLLFLVEQHGVACHTGNESCFYRSLNKPKTAQKDKIQNLDSIYNTLDTLYHTLEQKHYEDPQNSYTASLFAKGTNSISKKIIEESAEFCFALKDKQQNEIIYECADLLYHMLVGLASEHINIERVYRELKRRMGISGLEEKASREK